MSRQSSVLTKLSTHQNSHFTSLAIPNHNDIKLIKLCTVKYSLKTTGGIFLGQPPNCTAVHYSALQCIITLQLMTVCRQYVEILRPLSTSVTYYAIKVTDITWFTVTCRFVGIWLGEGRGGRCLAQIWLLSYLVYIWCQIYTWSSGARITGLPDLPDWQS